MSKTLTLSVEVSSDHKVTLKLPNDFPSGLADVVITPATYRPNRLGDLLDPAIFGLWRDHEEIEDSGSFARVLRDRAWSRSE